MEYLKGVYELETELLKFALIDSYGSDKFFDFTKKSLKKRTWLTHNSTSGSNTNVLTDYKRASGPQSFGRHLLTQLLIDSKTIPSIRTQEIEEAEKWQTEYSDVIKDIRNTFPKEYEEALTELKKIIRDTRNRIKSAKNVNSLTLYRNLTLFEVKYDCAPVPANIISSYTNDRRVHYKLNDWSGTVIKREIPIDQIITHAEYLEIVGFMEEAEVLVYNPKHKLPKDFKVIKKSIVDEEDETSSEE
ncbi:hypothetical protein U8V72_20940 [Priestia filamentosa]|uniref:hypothetical protein n=1 Tax=Priestia filamentosa TaxID=1402861 RepID=UPI00397D0316